LIAEQARLREALMNADWETLIPRLVAYTRRRLRGAGWLAGRDEEPSALSVEQLIDTAVERCLDGTREWDPESVDLAGLLCGVIRSLTSTEFKKYKRATSSIRELSNDFERGSDTVLTSTAEEQLLAEEARIELLDEVAACARGDDELEHLYAAILEGHTTREELATALGWTRDRVTAARVKLQRRLVSHCPSRFATMPAKSVGGGLHDHQPSTNPVAHAGARRRAHRR
jgi:hypothetical protein